MKDELIWPWQRGIDLVRPLKNLHNPSQPFLREAATSILGLSLCYCDNYRDFATL